MSLFLPKKVTLRDGGQVLLRSPEVEEAKQLIDYLDVIRHDTPFLMWGPDDELPSLDKEREWVKAPSR